MCLLHWKRKELPLRAFVLCSLKLWLWHTAAFSGEFDHNSFFIKYNTFSQLIFWASLYIIICGFNISKCHMGRLTDIIRKKRDLIPFKLFVFLHSSALKRLCSNKFWDSAFSWLWCHSEVSDNWFGSPVVVMLAPFHLGLAHASLRRQLMSPYIHSDGICPPTLILNFTSVATSDQLTCTCFTLLGLSFKADQAILKCHRSSKGRLELWTTFSPGHFLAQSWPLCIVGDELCPVGVGWQIVKTSAIDHINGFMLLFLTLSGLKDAAIY